jgi:hypothetical protein
VSHRDLRINLDVSHMCDRIKSHIYNDSWYRNQCQIFIIQLGMCPCVGTTYKLLRGSVVAHLG